MQEDNNVKINHNNCTKPSLCENLFFLQDNWSGEFWMQYTVLYKIQGFFPKLKMCDGDSHYLPALTIEIGTIFNFITKAGI